jgi:hypothetical protein
MTILELHTAFKLELDKTDSEALPIFRSEEVDYWLNKAINHFLKTRYNLNNIYKKAFEGSQKRIDDLRVIVTNETIVPNVTDEIDLPGNYVFLLRVTANVLSDCGIVKSLPFQVETDDLNKLLDDPFNKPTIYRPLYNFRDNKIIFYTSEGSEITNATITYIRKPAVVNYEVDSTSEYTDLPDHVHHEVVQKAVNMALENIESPRYRSNINELNNIE